MVFKTVAAANQERTALCGVTSSRLGILAEAFVGHSMTSHPLDLELRFLIRGPLVTLFISVPIPQTQEKVGLNGAFGCPLRERQKGLLAPKRNP